MIIHLSFRNLREPRTVFHVDLVLVVVVVVVRIVRDILQAHVHQAVQVWLHVLGARAGERLAGLQTIFPKLVVLTKIEQEKT